MSLTAETEIVHAEPSLAEVGDYVALLKPRVMSLVVFTAVVGLVVAPGTMHPVLAAVSLLCIAVGAGAAGALNMWYDADIDALMARTSQRPLPRGVVSPGEALAFGVTLAVGSVAVLGLVANWFAAALLAFTIFFYVVVYTIWLKRSTAQNIVIGGAAGAFPPMVGWAAKTGGLDVEPLLLFLIIFFWTPPHFWALALIRSNDYVRAGVPMLPCVAGEAETRRQILLYSILLAPLGVSPWLFGHAGLGYAAVSGAAGLAILWLGFEVYRRASGRLAQIARKRLFGFSLVYLFALFATLLAERLFGFGA